MFFLPKVRLLQYDERNRQKLPKKYCRKLAKDNMPFMSLEIHGLQEIQIDPDLPHSDNMRNR